MTHEQFVNNEDVILIVLFGIVMLTTLLGFFFGMAFQRDLEADRRERELRRQSGDTRRGLHDLITRSFTDMAEEAERRRDLS